MITKLVAVEGALAAIIVAADNVLSGTAETIILFSTAGVGLVWFWHNVLRPIAKIVRRAAAAVDGLEHLPEMRQQLDDLNERVEKTEDRGRRNANAMKAIIRELGIEDQVRRMDPDDFEA